MTHELAYLPADIFPLTPIARAALAGRPAPASLAGMCIPDSIAAVPYPADRLEKGARLALARLLEARLASFGPHVAVLESARALEEPGASCVITGQQPGFLGGPLFNVYKALSAIRLARDLAQAWERPVVPIFWNHADDHDIAEVHSLHFVNPNLDLRKVALPGMSSGKRPLSAIVLDEATHRLGPIADLLRQLLPETAYREEALAAFLPQGGESLARAFTRAYLDLLGPLGLIVLEPEWLRPSLSRALAHVVGLEPLAALRTGAAKLAAAGHAPAIDPETAALVFHHDESGRRLALRGGGDGFRYDDELGSRTPSELAAEILDQPERWSAGALLRPLVQDAALPVAAYVGGYGELAYHAELPDLRAAAELPATPFVPRLAATLVDPETRAALERLELSVADALAGQMPSGEGEPEARPEIALALRAVAARAADDLGNLREGVAAVDRGLGLQVKKTSQDVVELVERLAQKIERVQQNKSGKSRRHLRRIQSILRPRELPQERVLSALEYTARYGRDWIEVLLNEIDAFPSEHLVVHLPGTTT